MNRIYLVVMVLLQIQTIHRGNIHCSQLKLFRAITCETLQGSQSDVSDPESTRRPFSFANPLPPEERTEEKQLVLGNEKYVVSPGLKLRIAGLFSEDIFTVKICFTLVKCLC